jgi:hypothetical protein
MMESRQQPHQFSVGGVHTCAPTQAKITSRAIIACDQSHDQSESPCVHSHDGGNLGPLRLSDLTITQKAILELVGRALSSQGGKP